MAATGLGPSGIGDWLYTKKRRVALIGTGWYGKSDLFRLMQVAPIEIVGICDADRNQMSDRKSTRLNSSH